MAVSHVVGQEQCNCFCTTRDFIPQRKKFQLFRPTTYTNSKHGRHTWFSSIEEAKMSCEKLAFPLGITKNNS